MNLIDTLNWRYATKQMNGERVPQEKVNRIIEAARLAPTGANIQPFEIFSISNKELKEKLKAVAFNQPQVGQASHVLVFAAWDAYTEERINEVFDRNNRERNLDASATEVARQNTIAYLTSKSPELQFRHAEKQAAIALGFSIVSAAIEEVDATPMEGFDPKALDELLNLSAKGLKSTTLLALGYRDAENDWSLKMKKVRKPLSELLTEFN
jgi:nitroreductase